MIKICNTNIKVINLYILKGPLFNECSVVVAASIKIPHLTRMTLYCKLTFSNYSLLSFCILFITKIKRILKDNKKSKLRDRVWVIYDLFTIFKFI